MSDYTTTPNYGLFKPAPGEDDDAWGTHLNSNSDVIDSTLKTLSDSIGGVTAGVTTFNTRSGAVVLLSADVTTALTFTPYSNANPAGYQTAANVTASLAPYALTASVPAGSSATPLVDGTATAGAATSWSRADHVHPTDTTRYAATNPSGYQTAANVTTALAPYALTSALPAASSATPLVESGAGAVGVGTTWARADHVHPAAAGGGGGIAEAPTDGTIYGRQGSTTSWLGVLPLTGGSLQKSVALSGNSDIVLSVGDSTTARNQPLTYSYTAGASSGAVSRLGFNVYTNASGTITRANTARGGWFFELDNRDAATHADIVLRATTAAGVTTSPHTFGATGNFIITNNMQVGGVYRTSGGVQVLQARIGGWGATAPVNGSRINSFDANTATLIQTAQALAALLVDLRTHGVIGT